MSVVELEDKSSSKNSAERFCQNWRMQTALTVQLLQSIRPRARAL
jgi:hypothetical protein